MKKNHIIFLLWLELVIIWNVFYAQATPLEDIIIAVLLSFMVSFLKKR